MRNERYPLAEPKMDGTEYGPLPDKGYTDEQVRLIFHSTETAGVPSYGDGDTAPHFSYVPLERRWIQHADLDKRVGTDKSSGNPVSIAVELIAYSDRSLTEGYPDRLWVGDFTEEHFEDLADFCVWLQRGPWPELDLGHRVYGPKGDFPSWKYGSSAETRLSWDEWDAAGGFLTAHGASPSGTTHWDTGELDLYRLSSTVARKLEEDGDDEWPEDPDVSLIKYGDYGGAVQYWAAILHYRGRDIAEDYRWFDDVFKAALMDELPNASGKKITGRQGAMIMNRLWRD